MCCKPRVTFPVFKLGSYVGVYVGRICHVSVNLLTNVKKNHKNSKSLHRAWAVCGFNCEIIHTPSCKYAIDA